jgi:hypothetical protein
MADVRIKVFLQGGHLWEFSCDQDDPILFGLLSALPGANLDANLPADGLIQVESRTGERLFLSRSSLVSVEVVHPPASSASPSKPPNWVASNIPEGMSGPSAFILVHDALPGHIHRALLEDALAQAAALPSSNPTEPKLRELELGSLTQPVAMALRWKAEKARSMLGIFDVLESHAHFSLFAIDDAQELPLTSASGDILRLVYHFHKKPKTFMGGGVRLFDAQVSNNPQRLAFRDLEIEDNSLLIFPSTVVSSSLPVRYNGAVSADRLFAIRGVLRRPSK